MNIRFETDTGGTMQLTDHDALGSIDNKGTLTGHEGNFTHIDLFFLRGLLVLITESDIEGGTVGLAINLAFHGAHFGLFKTVAYKIEARFLFKSKNWEELTKNRLQAYILPLGGFNAGLKKFFVRFDLQFNEVRRLDGLVEFAEGDAVRHGAGSVVSRGCRLGSP